MSSVDVLYILIGTCIAVITVAFVWLVNEAIALIKSLKVSAKNTETISEELKEKTMLVSESLDRVGTVATRVISFVEDMEEAVEQKAGAISSSIGVIAGAKKYFVDGKKEQKDEGEKARGASSKTEEKKEAKAKTTEAEVEEVKTEKAEKDDEKEEEVKEEKVEEVEKEDESLVIAGDEGAEEPEEEVTEVKVKPDKQKAQEVEVEVS